MGTLGCGSWSALLQCRGGGVLTELPVGSLSMGRRLDDMSDARVTITERSLLALFEPQRSECLGFLDGINPWEHELALWRNDDEAWVGPVVQPAWGVTSIDVVARDLFQWYEKRRLWRTRTFVGADLGTIFERYAIDALHHDPTPAISIEASATGVTGDRSILAGAYRRAADEMRELARSGIDFTALGRRILVGGTEIPTAALGTLITEDFAGDGPVLVRNGLDAATQTVVVGTNRTKQGDPIVGVAGGIDPELGLLQEVFNESSVGDTTSAAAAAQSRLELLSKAPEVITGRLAPTAPVDFANLVPGARCTLKLRLLGREIDDVYRLHDVDVRVSADDSGVTESVDVQFVTIGTVDDEA